jgi:glucokinase
MILAGDVGGTNVRLALIEVEGGKLARKDEKTFLSRDVPGLEQPVEEFLAGRRVAASGFGVAGPVRTLEHFASIYGGEAGNLALKVFATGGVFVGGGIAPKILPKLLDGTFFGAFCDKGRFAAFLARIPIKVVVNDACALLGAARLGAESGGAA